MKKTVYYLGNPLVKEDNLLIKIIPKLKKLFPQISFIHFDPTEELKTEKNKELIFIDTVVGINKVIKSSSLNHWTLSPRVSAHDYDLPLQLGILTKLKKIKSLIIIGIPSRGNENEAVREVGKILKCSILNPPKF